MKNFTIPRLEMRFLEVKLTSKNHRGEQDYAIKNKIRRTLHFTSDMMYYKAYNIISNNIPGSMSQK